MTISIDTLLTSASGRNLAERILDKEFLKRVEIKGTLFNDTKSYGLAKPMPTKEGTYFRFSRKQNIRQPETDPMTSGVSSDPAGGFSLLMDQVLLPIESHRDYADIDILTSIVSWTDVEEWVRNDMAKIAWPRRANRLLWNALVNGRMTPGVYAADGTISTAFDRTAAASLSRWGITFTFTALPRVFGGGRVSFEDLQPDDYLTWNLIRQTWVGMDLAGSPKIKGDMGPGYVCSLSSSMWNDLLLDNDGGRLDAAIKGGMRAAIKGLEDQAVFHYAGTYFVIESDPYTMNAGDDVARAVWGDYHVAAMFGQQTYGFTSLGATRMSNFKVTDTTKTGAMFSIGARIHWNCRVINENFGNVIIAPVRISKPNNYSASNTQTHGFEIE